MPIEKSVALVIAGRQDCTEDSRKILFPKDLLKQKLFIFYMSETF